MDGWLGWQYLPSVIKELKGSLYKVWFSLATQAQAQEQALGQGPGASIEAFRQVKTNATQAQAQTQEKAEKL